MDSQKIKSLQSYLVRLHQGEDLASVRREFEKDLLEALRPENCVAARTSYGGPAPKENAKQLTLGRSLVDGQKKTLHELVTKR